MGRIRQALLDLMADGPQVALTHLLDPSLRSKAPQNVSSYRQGFAQWSDWDTRKAMLEGYNAHFLVYRCMTMRGNALRSLPFVALDETTGELLSDSHPAARMLAKPNPALSFGEIKYRAELFLCGSGDAYWYINKVGDSVRLDPLRSDRMSIKPFEDTSTGKIHRIYVYTIDGKEYPFDNEEIVHISLYNPLNDLFGLPPLRASGRRVDTSNAIQDFQYNAMKNGVWPSGTLSVGNVNDKQWEALNKQIDEDKKGPVNARRLFVVGDGRGFVPSAPTPVEMDLMGGSSMTNQDICIGMGVGPEIFGFGSGTYENKRMEKRAMWEATIIPEGNTFTDAMNAQLAPVFDNTRFAYDLSNTLPMVEARKASIDSAEKVWKLGVPWNVINKTMKLGFPEFEGDDASYVHAMMLPVTSSGEGRSIRSINPETDEQMEVYWRSIDRRKQSFERGYAIEVGKRFAAEADVVTAAIIGGKVQLDEVIDGQRSKWEKLISTILRTVINDAGDWIADQLNSGQSEVGGEPARALAAISEHRPESRTGYEFDPWNELIREWVTTKTAEDVKAILDTTKKRIRTVVLDGLKTDKTMPEIARAVRDQFEAWQKGEGVYRSMLVARTEVHRATGFGHHESARQSGVVNQKSWLSAMDPPRAREMHMEISGQWIAFDEAYEMADGATMQHPGDGPADHVVLCRCAEMYRTR